MPAIAAIVPVVLLAVAVAIPLAFRSSETRRTDAEAPVRIDMKVEGDGIRLAWQDGRPRPYKVYKSSDPRHLGRGQGHLVQGNQWVDSEPDTAPIVFYRVE
jgi:hypothetical protein